MPSHMPSVTGKYNAVDFSVGDEEVVLLKGSLTSLKTGMDIETWFVFSSTRVKYEGSAWFSEQLVIKNADGTAFAVAHYEDAGKDILSTVESADYQIVSANGCLDALEGGVFNITFFNDRENKPRAIEYRSDVGDDCGKKEKKEEVAPARTSGSLFMEVLSKLLE